MEEEVMSESYESGDMQGNVKQYIPKQFDLERLITLPKKERKMLMKLMTGDSMFREEARTTLETYGLIIDQREGTINQLLKD